MTVHLPEDLELSLNAMVADGRFSSLNAAIVEATRRLVLDSARMRQANLPTPGNEVVPNRLIGLMRDDCELMDEIVADAYRLRRIDAEWAQACHEKGPSA